MRSQYMRSSLRWGLSWWEWRWEKLPIVSARTLLVPPFLITFVGSPARISVPKGESTAVPVARLTLTHRAAVKQSKSSRDRKADTLTDV
jgi:hypothetical protein